MQQKQGGTKTDVGSVPRLSRMAPATSRTTKAMKQKSSADTISRLVMIGPQWKPSRGRYGTYQQLEQKCESTKPPPAVAVSDPPPTRHCQPQPRSPHRRRRRPSSHAIADPGQSSPTTPSHKHRRETKTTRGESRTTTDHAHRPRPSTTHHQPPTTKNAASTPTNRKPTATVPPPSTTLPSLASAGQIAPMRLHERESARSAPIYTREPHVLSTRRCNQTKIHPPCLRTTTPAIFVHTPTSTSMQSR